MLRGEHSSEVAMMPPPVITRFPSSVSYGLKMSLSVTRRPSSVTRREMKSSTSCTPPCMPIRSRQLWSWEGSDWGLGPGLCPPGLPWTPLICWRIRAALALLLYIICRGPPLIILLYLLPAPCPSTSKEKAQQHNNPNSSMTNQPQITTTSKKENDHREPRKPNNACSTELVA